MPPSPASPPPPTTPHSPAATSSSRRSSRTPPSRPRPPAAPRPPSAPDAIFATNTSTLPIASLAEASRAPGNFIGIHFFSPVEKMQLVEIIRGEATSDRAVAKALDFVRQIRKTPIVVNDARFFYANRCIIPYLNEGMRMVAEGIEPALIENAARQLGMPLGPLQLVDETSIDLGVKIARATKAAMGDAYPESPADAVLFALADRGRLGRKAGRGLLRLRRQGQAPGPVARAALDLAGRRPALAGGRPAPARDGPGARGRPRARGGRHRRRPRGRRGCNPRLGLHALVRRPLRLARHPRRRPRRRDGRGPRRRPRPPLRPAPACCGRWPPPGRPSMARSARRRLPEPAAASESPACLGNDFGPDAGRRSEFGRPRCRFPLRDRRNPRISPCEPCAWVISALHAAHEAG